MSVVKISLIERRVVTVLVTMMTRISFCDMSDPVSCGLL